MNRGADVRPLCPSAQPSWPGSVLIGVVGGTACEPQVRFVSEPQPVSPALLQIAGPVHPAEVFRFAAPCLCTGCVHFAAESCQLAQRVVAVLPEVSTEPPPCPIRRDCRWWRQEGVAACLRCPQVVTDNYNPGPAMVTAAGAQSHTVSHGGR